MGWIRSINLPACSAVDMDREPLPVWDWHTGYQKVMPFLLSAESWDEGMKCYCNSVMSLPAYEACWSNNGICKCHHQKFASAFVRMLGFTSGNRIWWGNQRDCCYCWASLLFLEDDDSFLQTDYNNKNIHKRLCEFLFQNDMRSLRTAASLLLLICYIAVILVAPLCKGQGKAPLSLLQRAQKCLL